MQRLPIEPISQASAQQRSGRCGRVEAGIAIRLYSEEDFARAPGVHRAGDPAHLAGQRDPADDLAGPRPGRAVPVRRPAGQPRGAGRRTAAGGARCAGPGCGQRPGRDRGSPASAASWRGCRSTRGWRRMILEADRLGCLREVLVITAALSIQDPRERPVEKRARADQLHARFRDPTLGLHGLAQPVAAPAREAEGDGLQRLPADVPRGAPELPARARVAGLRVPAAPGRQAGGAQGRAARPGSAPDEDGDPPGAALRPALPHRAARRRPARLPRRPRDAVRDLPRLRPVQVPARPGDGRRAGRDQPAVGTAERRHRPGSGPRSSVATW